MKVSTGTVINAVASMIVALLVTSPHKVSSIMEGIENDKDFVERVLKFAKKSKKSKSTSRPTSPSTPLPTDEKTCPYQTNATQKICSSILEFKEPRNPNNLDISELSFPNGIKLVDSLGFLEEVGILKELLDNKTLAKVSRDSLEFFLMMNETTSAPDLGGGGIVGDYLGGMFGDYGYLYPGYGGVSAYDVYNVLTPITLVHLDRKSRFRNTTTSPDDSIYPMFGIKPKTTMPNFWSRIEDINKRDLNTYQNEVTQTCAPYDIITKCDFTKPTQLIVGTGAWRATNGNTQSGCDCGPFLNFGCNGTQNTDIYGKTFGPFANPQVRDNSVYQWLITMNVDSTTGNQISSNVTVKAISGSCITCPVNTADVSLSWDNAVNPITGVINKASDCQKIYFP